MLILQIKFFFYMMNMPTGIKPGSLKIHSYSDHEKAASKHKRDANRHQRSAARGRAREVALRQQNSHQVAFDDDGEPTDLLGKAVLGVLSVMTLPITMRIMFAEKHPIMASVTVLGGCVVGAMAAPFQAADDVGRTAESMVPNVSEATGSEEVEDCAQYSVRSIEGLHQHSKSILKKTGKHHIEENINHGVKMIPGFTVSETSILQENSSIIPAIKMVSAIIDNIDEGSHNHTMHGRELLKHVLGVPVHSLSHEEIDNMCGLTQMFDPVQQANDIAAQFISDIKSLIHDRELTAHMRLKFQEEYLAHFRDQYPKSQWDAFVPGFNSMWMGELTEFTLLIKAMKDIQKGEIGLTCSPEVVHGLTLASHTWMTTVAPLIPEKVALDSLVSLGKSIYYSRAKLCDYLRTAATVAMSVGGERVINEGGFIERDIPDLGRARNVAEIRRNALVFQSRNHKTIYPSIERETAIKNNARQLKSNSETIRNVDRGSQNCQESSRIRARCRREGEDLCLPGAGKLSGDSLGVSGEGARSQANLKFENSLRKYKPIRDKTNTGERAKEKPPWNRNSHTGVEVHLGVKKCSGTECSRVRHQKPADDVLVVEEIEGSKTFYDANDLVAKSLKAEAKRTRHRGSRLWGQRDNSPLLGPFQLHQRKRGDKSQPMFPAKDT